MKLHWPLNITRIHRSERQHELPWFSRPDYLCAPVFVTLKHKHGRKNRLSPRHPHFCMTDICRVLFRLKWLGWKPQLNSTWPYPQHVIFFSPPDLMWIPHMTCLDPHSCPGDSQFSPRVSLLNSCTFLNFLNFGNLHNSFQTHTFCVSGFVFFF